MSVKKILYIFSKNKPSHKVRAIFNVNGKYIVSAYKVGTNPKDFMDGLFQVKEDGTVIGYSPLIDMKDFQQAIKKPLYKVGR